MNALFSLNLRNRYDKPATKPIDDVRSKQEVLLIELTVSWEDNLEHALEPKLAVSSRVSISMDMVHSKSGTGQERVFVTRDPN